MKPVRLTHVAESDIAEAAAWYEAEREGLGVQFVDRVQQAIDRIAENPMGYAKVIEDARRAPLEQFPYGLWYRVEPDESVVIACLHGKRSPRLTRERALGIIPMPRKPEPS